MVRFNKACPRRFSLQISTAVIILVFVTACDSGPWQDNCVSIENDPSQFTNLTFENGVALFKDGTVFSGTGHIHDLDGIEQFYDASVGGGVAVEDFDQDSDLDIIVTGGIEDNGYYVNQGDGTFLNCANSAGLNPGNDWTLGVSIADIDNDGDRDVILLNNGPNRLLRNLGDGSFEDITADSNIAGDGRSAGASWADLDGDGLLDLFIANLASEFPTGGSPEADKSQLYRNRGQGVFEDVSEQVGNSGLRDGACYIAPMIDFDGDSYVDLLITQEFGQTIERNQLYKNLGPADDGTWINWENKTPDSNIQYPYAAMGTALMDLNQDQLPEVFITNLIVDEPLREVLLMNQGDFTFEDITNDYGANSLEVDAAQDLYRTASWGTVNLDYDNDGDDDLYTVYGTITPVVFQGMNCQSYSPVCLNQPNALLRNDDNQGFTQQRGANVEDNGLGRGVAVADLNGDGCVDLYLVNQSTPSRLLLNNCDSGNFSFFLNLEGTVSNRDAVGSVVTIQTGDHIQTKYITAGSTSVHSSQPFVIHIGTGLAQRVDAMTIRWPSGLEEVFEPFDLNVTGPLEVYAKEGTGILDF